MPSFIQVSKLKCLQDPVAHCTDGVRSFDETDVDCGGSHCPDCAAGQACVVNLDCDPNCQCNEIDPPPAPAVCECS